MYFSLLRIGAVEAAYWFGSKKKIGLKKKLERGTVELRTFESSPLHEGVSSFLKHGPSLSVLL